MDQSREYRRQRLIICAGVPAPFKLSYAGFFTDPNGICFEIFTEPMTVQEFRRSRVASSE